MNGIIHGYCLDCDWYATPEDHSHDTVFTAADSHALFHPGHTVKTGSSEETVAEATDRAGVERAGA